MLHRFDDAGLTVISQPAHAWISGQIAAQWGNEDLGYRRPSLELVIATEQHDIAWLDWESRPTLNPETGLPYAFNQMPTAEHLSLWNHATERSLTYGRLPALLISMHGTYLYRRFHDFDRDTLEDAAAARKFLEVEESFQSSTLEALEEVGDISQSIVETMRAHLSLWDAMSLALCMGFDEPRDFEAVPTGIEPVVFRPSGSDDAGDIYEVDPWPFRSRVVRLRCEGRRLEETFSDVESMRAAVASAPGRTLRIQLQPVESVS